ncbi:MAG TPA: LCP family protein [Acidimicrobiales bacterium]|nr:LCP family protein [Acidimicrobiales bacterium]
MDSRERPEPTAAESPAPAPIAWPSPDTAEHGGEAAPVDASWTADAWRDEEWIDEAEWVDDVAEPETFPGGTVAEEEGIPAFDFVPVVGAGSAGPSGAGSAGSSGEDDEPAEAPEPTGDDVAESAVAAWPKPRRRSRFGMRAAAFAAAVLVLTVAVPALTWIGWQWVQHSRTGVTRSNSSGLLGGGDHLVPYTATALVVTTDAGGTPTSVALFTLDHGTTGGSVTFVPLDTLVPRQAYGIDRLRTAFVRQGMAAFVRSASQILGLTFSDTIVLDPAAMQQYFEPVGNLAVSSPAAFSAGGVSFPQGVSQLDATRALAYLDEGSAAPGDVAARQQAFWAAWADLVRQRGDAVIAGEPDAGLGRYLSAFARGTVDFAPFPVKAEMSPPNPLDGGSTRVYRVDSQAAGRRLALVVPFPQASTDDRLMVRLLNGVDSGGIPRSIVQRLVIGGGQVGLEGTSPNSGLEITEIRYGDRSLLDRVKVLRAALGAGKLVIDDTVSDPGEVTIVLGHDLLDRPPAALTSDTGSNS